MKRAIPILLLGSLLLLPAVSALTLTRLSNPATLPVGQGNTAAFSPDGKFLAVSDSTTPFITIYAISGTTFTKLADPATPPTGVAAGIAFSPNSNFLAVAHDTSPFITIYSISGNTFTKLADPANLPAGTGQFVAFSPDGLYMAVAHSVTPFVTIYSITGNTFTKLANPSSLPAGTGSGVAFAPGSNYMAVAHSTTPFITIYSIASGVFSKLTNPATLPPSAGIRAAFDPSGHFLAVTSTSSPYVTIYDTTTGNPFTKLANPATLPAAGGEGVAFSPDGSTLAVGTDTTPFVRLYSISGTTFTAQSNPATLPEGPGFGPAFNPAASVFALAMPVSPYIALYSTDISFSPGITPTAPSGLSASVTQVQTNPSGDLIELRWPVSSNDPSQTTGSFSYHIFFNGADTYTDTVTGADGGGQRFNQVSINTAGFVPATHVFWIVAYNGVSFSPNSCSVSINDGALNFKSCGSATTGAATTSGSQVATDVGSGLKTFSSNLLGSSSGSLFFAGMLYVLLAFLGMAAAFSGVTKSVGMPTALAGTIAAIAMSLFNALNGIWDIWVEAVFIVIVGGITSYFVRKMFFKGESET